MKRIFQALLLFAACFSIWPISAEADFPHSSLQLEAIPAYSDGSDYYIDINDGIPDFEIWQRTTFPFVLFSDLDDLGRVGPAYACLGPETLPTDTRKPMGNFHPSGWQSTQYGDIEGGYLYNRSHLIGYQLCGDNGSPENLFTGTRNLNAGSMLMVETAVEQYGALSDCRNVLLVNAELRRFHNYSYFAHP